MRFQVFLSLWSVASWLCVDKIPEVSKTENEMNEWKCFVLNCLFVCVCVCIYIHIYIYIYIYTHTHSLIQSMKNQSKRVTLLFHLKTWYSGMGRDPSPHKVETCFVKVELTIILNGFLIIRLSFPRSECNADRCPSRKRAKYAFCERLGFSFDKQYLRIDFLFFRCILNEQRIHLVQLGRLKKALKCNDTYLHLRISCATDKATFYIRMRFVILNSTNIRNANFFTALVYSIRKIMCFLNSKACQHMLHQIHKIIFKYS